MRCVASLSLCYASNGDLCDRFSPFIVFVFILYMVFVVLPFGSGKLFVRIHPLMWSEVLRGDGTSGL